MRFYTGLLSAVCLVTVLLHVAGAGPLRSTFWGVNAYGFFPPVLWMISSAAILLGAGFLAFRGPPSAGSGPERARPTSGRWVHRALLAGVIMLPVFWIFRARHAFLGDGFSLMIDLPRGVDFDPNHPLTYALQQVLYRSTRNLFAAGSGSGGMRDLLPPAVGSCLLGSLFVIVCVGIARELLRGTRDRPALPTRGAEAMLAAILIAQGSVQLFFGYVENYSFYALGVALYLLASLRFLAGRSPLVLPLAVLVVSIGFHLSAVILVPSAALLVLMGLRDPGRRKRTALNLVLAGVLFVSVTLFLHELARRSAWFDRPYWLPAQILRIGTRVVAGTDEGPAGLSYLLSLRHARDLFNEYLLIGPLGLLLFLPGLAYLARRRGLREPGVLFLAILGGSCLLTGLIAGDSNLGFARNWDLLAPSGLAFTVAGMFFLVKAERGRRLTAPLLMALLLSLYHVVPWVLLNASFDRSLERFAELPLGGGRVESTLSTWYWNTRHFDESSAWSRRALVLNPANSMAYRNLGMVEMQDGDCAGAEVDFAKALEIRPDIPDYHRNLAEAMMCAGRLVAAGEHLDYVLDRDPRNVDVLVLDARRLCLLEQFGKALARAMEAVRLRPDAGSRQVAAAVCVGHGDMLARQERWSEARHEFEKSGEFEAADVHVNTRIGTMFAHERDWAEALASFREALRLDPGSARLLFNIGLMLQKVEGDEAARASWTRALDLSDSPEVTARVEEALAGLGARTDSLSPR